VTAPPSLPDGGRLVLLHDEAAVARAVARMAEDVDRALDGASSVLVLGLLLGGAYAAVWLSARLRTPHRIEFLRVSRYANEERGHEVVWEGALPPLERRTTVVVVDDVFDEGLTLAAVRARLAAGGVRVLTAVLARKNRARSEGLPEPDVFGLEVPDEWLVGCGLDFRGWGRHYPALYALRRTESPSP
jgi:hypoxanthine phosphoribosyltransferase